MLRFIIGFLVLFTYQNLAALSPEISPSCGDYPAGEYDQSALIETSCQLPNIKIYSVDPISTELVCQGVKRANQFFWKKLRFSLRPIEIYIVPEVPSYYLDQFSFDDLFGMVDTRDLRMYMPTITRFMAQESGLMGIPLNEELYISYAAHETTHVLAQHYFRPKCLLMSSEQQEYIAYTVQLSTMKAAERDAVLQAFKDKKWQPFAKAKDITIAYHAINPHGFAVKSYLFYQTKDGKKTFRDFLAGKVKPNPGDF